MIILLMNQEMTPFSPQKRTWEMGICYIQYFFFYKCYKFTKEITTFPIVMLPLKFALLFQGGDSGSKRPKFEQDGAGDIVIEPHFTEDKPMRIDQESSSSSSNRDAEASTSSNMKLVKNEEPGADLLPKELNGMTISDDKADGHNDKVISISL